MNHYIIISKVSMRKTDYEYYENYTIISYFMGHQACNTFVLLLIMTFLHLTCIVKGKNLHQSANFSFDQTYAKLMKSVRCSEKLLCAPNMSISVLTFTKNVNFINV